ncbi:MAG: prepilin-type N-terminal cleavage/methylation domain-containing protein [Kiritimatiellia bacterium]
MKTNVRKRRAARAGFSLVEVTLALLVVAVGLTATFALFPEGLKATRAAVDDTEIGMFAEYVFTTLDLTAGKYGANWNIGQTDDFISPMLSQDADPKYFRLEEFTGNPTNFYWCPDFYGIDVSKAESDLSHLYFKEGDPPFWTSAFTYTLEVALGTWKGYGSGVTTYAVLKVWPGEHMGSEAMPKGTPRIFYREILPIR